MFDSTFISCPKIGFEHTLEITTKEYNKVNGSPQYDVHYPTTTPYTMQQLGDDLARAQNLFIKEARAAFEASYSDFLDADLYDLPDDEEIDDVVPACGDCGGCCECLGDPPDTRWDTLAERGDYYMETSGS